MEFLSTKSGKIMAFLAILLLVALIVLASHGFVFASIALWILLGTLVLCIGLEFAHRAWKNRRQRRFDAELSAKEGIADRRKEWAGWTEELRRQKIDRYELPMFLLVGEPQSGKSVMLQKSDLHFPLGQNKLSGVGGTRGCDWWFTDEAVVLDLAGRLFTHEGGASDEAEWAAFLELLVDYRPQCPANGVILVLPCDGLLKDSEAQCAAKAGRMQAALITLTNKLEARLPVHVVLTKADKIFGFAECVHALETAKRHEMFGWSRSNEKVEAVYDQAEAREAFEGLVDRARILRSQVLSSTPIPEGIAQVDRAYAFPAELAALWPSLSSYLERIFGESRLVDRLFFRGFHLTCGLQSGAPIAKACADLAGATGEADRRSLEALFSKEKAFFIKDLIRKRIFLEKGLVRPTRARAQRARRTAVLAYGVSGVIAALAVLGSALFAARAYKAHDSEEFKSALAAANVAGESDAQLLAALDETDKAIRAAAASAEGSVIGSARNELEQLYAALFDRMLAPKLRARIEAGFCTGVDPADYEQFGASLEDARVLLEGWDIGDQAIRGHMLAYLAPARAGQPLAKLDPTEALRILKLRDSYGARPGISRPSGAAAAELAARAKELWEGVLTPGCAWQVRCHLGYVLASRAVRESAEKLDTASPEKVFELCRTFSSANQILDGSELSLFVDSNDARWVLDSAVAEQLQDLKQRFDTFYDGLAGVQKPPWESLKRSEEWIASAFAGKPKVEFSVLTQWRKTLTGQAGKCPLGLEAGKDVRGIRAPLDDIKAVRADADLKTICAREFLADENERLAAPWTAASLLRDLERFDAAKLNACSHRAQAVFRAKCAAIQGQYCRRFTGVVELRNSLGGPAASTYSPELTLNLARMFRALSAHALQDWSVCVVHLIEEYEAQLLRDWKQGQGELAPSVKQFGGLLTEFGLAPAFATDAHKSWKSQVEQWVVQACDPQIAKFEGLWRIVEDPDCPSPAAAASSFLQATSADTLRAKLAQAQAGQAELVDALRSLPAELQLTAAVLARLRAVSALLSAESLFNEVWVQRLREIATKVQSPGQGRIAKLFSSVGAAQRPLQADGGFTYVDNLFTAFKDCALKAERQAFLADFTALLESGGGTYRNLLQHAWNQGSGTAADLSAALVNFFGAGGALDKLLEPYGIAHPPAGAAPAAPGQLAAWTIDSFRSEKQDSTLSQWQAIAFVVHLQEYMLAAAKTKSLDQLVLTLAPFEGQVEADPTWKEDPHGYFYVRTRSQSPWGSIGVGPAKNNKTLTPAKPLELRPGSPDFEGLFLRWSTISSASERKDDYLMEWKGPFGGFVPIWNAPAPESGIRVQPSGAKQGTSFLFKMGVDPAGLPPRKPEHCPF